MNWVIILVIVAVVFILANVFKPDDETKRRQARPGEPPRPLGNDINQFLDEMNRLRRRAAEAPPAEPEEYRSEAPPRPAPAVRPPVPRPPRPRPRIQPPTPALAFTPPAPPPPPPVPRIVVAEPVILDVLPASTPRPSSPPAPPRFPDALPARSPAPAAAPVVAAPVVEKLPPAVTQLRSLLRSPQGLRNAMLLKEVLGPPRCRRN